MIVTIYTTDSCPYCNMAKEYLKANNIKFKEIDVRQHPEKGEEITQRSGEMGVPQIEIKKDAEDAGIIIVGFDKDALKKALKIK